MALLLGVSAVDGATRSDGYDSARHWMSLLSHGARGWLGSANLAVNGALLLASSVGFLHLARRRRVHPGLGLGVACFGAALVAAAVFPIDATPSYPGDGASPAASASPVSMSGRIHGLVGVALIAALAAINLLCGHTFDRAGRFRAAHVSRWCAGITVASVVLCGVLLGASESGTWEAVRAGAFQRCAFFVGGTWFIAFTGWTLLGGPTDRPLDEHRHRSCLP